MADGAIRALVDARPTYGYRRIAALLRRERRANGSAPLNAERVYRLMQKHDLLLERHTGHRRPREHDGQVATIRSNCRWCADALEFTCWNGDIVRVAFTLDCHDREVISWTATTAGISGEMIRDIMVRCVEQLAPPARRIRCSFCRTTARSSPLIGRSRSRSRSTSPRGSPRWKVWIGVE
jgi:putative transposase